MKLWFQNQERTAIKGIQSGRDYPIIPRVGERVATADKVFHVDMVTHDTSDDRIYITVSPL